MVSEADPRLRGGARMLLRYTLLRAITRSSGGTRLDRVRQDQVRKFLEGEDEEVRKVRTAIDLAVGRFPLIDAARRGELAQEALGRVFLNVRAGRFRGDASLPTYANRVAKYTCLEHLRRRRTDVDMEAGAGELPSPAMGPEDSLARQEEHRRNVRAFAALPPECRKLLLLVFVDGLSYRDVGEKLGISEGAVKLRVFRCRDAGRRTREESPAKPSGAGGHRKGVGTVKGDGDD